MCFLDLITWRRCGHYYVHRTMCKQALSQCPPEFCEAAHEPRALDVEEKEGPCPDTEKHPVANDGPSPIKTSGQGNAWYQQQLDQRPC